jgi:nucleoside-diphosphate-sugar epimerase
MRVFVAGASGAIGRRLVPQLLQAGHEVTGMTRSEESAERLRSAGAEAAAVCDAFDADRLRDVVVRARPEVVVNELTSLPERFDPRSIDYEPTNRVRVEGGRNLIAAASEAGASRLIIQSIAFLYAPEGGPVKDEEALVYTEAPGRFRSGIEAMLTAERDALEAPGMEGLVLRYGWFYGPGTYYAQGGSQAEDVRRRRFPIVGKGSGVFSFIHLDDAASATVAAVERGSPGVYNVVDDEPAPLREWLPVYAEAIGAKPPFRVPAWIARLVAGPFAAAMAIELRGASNAKAKRELGWQPRYPSWRQGFREGLG